MNIAVCDDEEYIRIYIKKLIEMQNEECRIIEFSSGAELLQFWQQEDREQIDILFLDISMDGTDGLKAAEQIRKWKEERGEAVWGSLPFLIFVTGYPEYMPKAFSVNAFWYLVKPIDKKEFEDVFARTVREFRYLEAKKNMEPREILEVKNFLGAAANEVAEKWGIGTVDTQEIEKNSKFTLDGGLDFNSVWNFNYRNQVGCASIADEGVEPPRDFKFFYKEHVDNRAKMEMWMGSQKQSIDVPFYITPDSLKGQLYNADELMKDFYATTDRAKEYSGFMKQLSLFTRWYSWESGINNRFGNFMPET